MCNCVSRSVPEIHQHVAGTLSYQQTAPTRALTQQARHDATAEHVGVSGRGQEVVDPHHGPQRREDDEGGAGEVVEPPETQQPGHQLQEASEDDEVNAWGGREGLSAMQPLWFSLVGVGWEHYM